MSGVYFNTQRPPYSDPRVRRRCALQPTKRRWSNKIALGNGLAQRSLIARLRNPIIWRCR